jgi:hypothetical protein
LPLDELHRLAAAVVSVASVDISVYAPLIFGLKPQPPYDSTYKTSRYVYGM